MVPIAHQFQDNGARGSGTRAGGPQRLTLRGFGWFSSVLLSLAAALFTFFLTTTIAIFSLLAWNLGGHHAINYADSYLYVGFPAGLAVLLIALPVFATLWLRSKFGK